MYGSFDGTSSLTITNPNGNQETRKLSLDFTWTTDVDDNVILRIKDPEDISYDIANDQQLSPDIAFSTGGSGEVLLSVVEPGATANPIQLSPDISFQTDAEGNLDISVVQPGASESYQQISPQISWDANDPKIAIVAPDATIASEDYIQIGIIHRGVWSGSTTYSRLDMVSYEGSAYVSLTDSNSNNIPSTSASEWALSAERATLDMSVTAPSTPTNGDMW